MYKYLSIKGNKELSGSIYINGAKNSALPLMIATTMTNDEVVLEDVPNIDDTKLVGAILERMGSKIYKEKEKNKEVYLIDNENLVNKDLMYEDVSKFRASYYFIGALIGKYKKVKILMPGGCFLGPRPIDLHIKGLEELGCTVKFEQDGDEDIMTVTAKQNQLIGSKIFLDFSSVGATINLMLAATFAKGETSIENAAKEPEVVDVSNLLRKMGANIKGAGTDVIRISGVKKLHGTTHQVIPDRIEAGTYIMIGSLLGSSLRVENIIPEHFESLSEKLKEIGIKLKIEDDCITVSKSDVLKAIDIRTGVHPSFPTDLQQVLTTLLTQIKGESLIIDAIYPSRFRNCQYLNKMGANIKVDTSDSSVGKAIITGKTKLKGEEVIATDLRAGASLIFAGLISEDETKIFDIEHILRGYGNICEKLTAVGADIEIIEEDIK